MNYRRLNQNYSDQNSCKESRKRGLKQRYFKISLNSQLWVMDFCHFRCTLKCKLKRFKVDHNFAFRNQVLRSATRRFYDRSATKRFYDRSATKGFYDRSVTKGFYDRSATKGFYDRSATKGFYDRFVSNNTLHAKCYSAINGGFREEWIGRDDQYSLKGLEENLPCLVVKLFRVIQF